MYPVSEVIEHTIRKSGDDAKGWAVTEVMERGNGRWQKVRFPSLSAYPQTH